MQEKPKTRFFQKKETPSDRVSEKEIMILSLLGDGLSVKEMADKMNVSPCTINTHKSAILNKLGFKHTIDLIKYAIREGIIKL